MILSFRKAVCLLSGFLLLCTPDAETAGIKAAGRKAFERPGRTLIPRDRWMTDAEAATLLGKLLAEDPARADESLGWYRKALSLAPDAFDAALESARLSVRLKRFSEGITLYRDLLARSSQADPAAPSPTPLAQPLPGGRVPPPTLWLELGRALLESGSPNEAREALLKGIEHGSGSSDLLRETLGDTLIALRQPGAAVEEFRAAQRETGQATAPAPAVGDRLERKIALALSSAGDRARAETALRAFHERFPRDAEITIELSRVLVQARKAEEALPLLHSLLEGDSATPQILAETGDVELSLGHFRQTRELYEKALSSVSPGDRDDLEWRWANRLQQMGDFQPAIDILRSAVASNPERLDLQTELAWALASCERYEEAESIYRRLVFRDAKHRGALQGMSNMFLLAKDFPSALSWSDSLLALEPRSVEGRLAKASALNGLRAFEQARPLVSELIRDKDAGIFVLQQCLRIIDRSPAGMYPAQTTTDLLGRMAGFPSGAIDRRFREGRVAATFLPALLASDREKARDLFAFGDLYAEVGSHTAAIDLYKKAGEKDPGLFQAGLNLGLQFGIARRFADAAAVFSKLETAYPGHFKLGLLKARLLSWNREFDASCKEYERLAKIDAANPVPVKELARVSAWAQWPRQSREAYQRFLNPGVDALLLADLKRIASPSPWLDEKRAQLSKKVATSIFRGFEAFQGAFEASRQPLDEPMARQIEEVLLSHLHRYKIQKYFFLERAAKEAVHQGHLRRSLPIFSELLEFAPGNEEARFDQSQTYCSLGLTDREETAYRDLLNIDPQHSLIQQARRKLQIDTRPQVRFSFERQNQEGRGQLARMESEQWRLAGTVELLPRWNLTVAENRWYYRPGIWNGRFRADGPSVALSGIFNEWARAEAGFSRKEFSGNAAFPDQKPRDRESHYFTTTFTIRDRFDLGLGFDRSDVYVNDIGLRDGTQADTRWMSLSVPFSRKFRVSGKVNRSEYSDGNAAAQQSWEAGYALTEFPEILRAIVSGDHRNTDRRTRYVFRNGILENILFPYWTPKGYWGRALTLQYYRDFSKLRIARADHTYLDLRWTFGDDSLANPSRRLDWTWHMDFSLRWMVELQGNWHDSPDWKARDFNFMLGYRF